MQTRRTALKTLATSAAALAAGGNLFAQAPAPAAPPAVAPTGPFTLPPLGYAFDALEPVIDAKTMEIHHDKHHKTYVDKLNEAVAKIKIEDESLSKEVGDLLKNLSAMQEDVRTAIRNHGGGHYNHTLFWQLLKKGTGGPQGALLKAIEASFGSFAKWQEAFGDAATKQFGSGWAWLVLRDKKLVVEATPNQDTPLSTGGQPILGIDVWEHAYYLKYQNQRPAYIKAFQEAINWQFAGERFQKLSA